MNVYLMLPLIDFKFYHGRREWSSKLTEEYARYFSNERFTYYTAAANACSKRPHYESSANITSVYTIIKPQTFKIYSEEVNK